MALSVAESDFQLFTIGTFAGGHDSAGLHARGGGGAALHCKHGHLRLQACSPVQPAWPEP